MCGGISIVEVTVPGPVDLMSQLAHRDPNSAGAGIVPNTDTARLCVDRRPRPYDRAGAISPAGSVRRQAWSRDSNRWRRLPSPSQPSVAIGANSFMASTSPPEPPCIG
jgi:hypothetical protein